MEALTSTWNFNIGIEKGEKTTTLRPDLIRGTDNNKRMAYDDYRPLICEHGLNEIDEAIFYF